MAQLSRLTKLFVKISDNLTEEDVRSLKALLSIEEVLGRAKIEKATPLEIFDMLVENKTIGKGNLGFLVQVLRSLRKGKLAEKAERLEQEQRMVEAAQPEDTTPSQRVDDTEANEFHQVTSRLHTALQLTQKTGDLQEKMELYFKKGEMQRELLHSPRTAIQYYEQYLALARQLGDRHKEGVAYNRLGHAYSDMGEYETALKCYRQNLKIVLESGDQIEQTKVHTNVGESYRLLGKLDQATSHFNTALQLAQQSGDLHEQMDVHCKMGDLQREQLHSPRTAIQYYEQHLALARQLGDRRKEGRTYNILGRAYYEIGEYETALEWCKKGLHQEGGDKIAGHLNVAASYKALGKLDQARSHYQSALDIAMETGNKQAQMDIYLRLGDLHRELLHEPQESHKYYTEMLALAKDLKRKDDERLAYNRLGLVCDGMQDNEAALEWHQKNLKMSEEDENKTEQLTAHQCIARSYQELGKLEQARSHYQLALIIAKETGNKQARKDIKKKIEAFKSCSIM